VYNVVDQVSDTAHVSVFYQSEVQYHSRVPCRILVAMEALSRQAIYLRAQFNTATKLTIYPSNYVRVSSYATEGVKVDNKHPSSEDKGRYSRVQNHHHQQQQ